MNANVNNTASAVAFIARKFNQELKTVKMHSKLHFCLTAELHYTIIRSLTRKILKWSRYFCLDQDKDVILKTKTKTKNSFSRVKWTHSLLSSRLIETKTEVLVVRTTFLPPSKNHITIHTNNSKNCHTDSTVPQRGGWHQDGMLWGAQQQWTDWWPKPTEPCMTAQ